MPFYCSRITSIYLYIYIYMYICIYISFLKNGTRTKISTHKYNLGVKKMLGFISKEGSLQKIYDDV